MPEKIPVLTAAEEVEYDATEFKFSKLVLHIRPFRLIHLFNTVTRFVARSVMRRFLFRCASSRGAKRNDLNMRRKGLLALEGEATESIQQAAGSPG